MSKLGTTAKARREAGLLEAVRDAKAGRAARVFVPDGKGGLVRSEVARARLASGLTQQKFASLLGVSLRTLQEWECADHRRQGSRWPRPADPPGPRTPREDAGSHSCP